MSMRNNKQSTPDQLALELPPAVSFAREDLIEGKANSLAIELIDAWPDWPGRVVILAGPVGCGKSHIGGVWAQMSGAQVMDINALTTLGDDRGNARTLLLENARAGAIDEVALFHVLNSKRAAGGDIMITSRTWPADWGISLADLNSRLRASQLVEIGEPDDDLLRGVLYKLFADRQIPVEPNVIEYLVVRMERSLEAANSIVVRLDGIGLARKRKITRQLAGEILNDMEAKLPG